MCLVPWVNKLKCRVVLSCAEIDKFGLVIELGLVGMCDGVGKCGVPSIGLGKFEV